ncbi:sensor domain-containing diguanylate cyclase [Sulfurimonas gotlandica]|uniref:sensor domain-containing diguanylate cyclase n=1 Tax=Sulfurimonas gotlandica TaxID=1176482 RepID=UPI000183AF99|nr:sensor domain-containing diguanylate cyclase [Sulfurimonas gotlandica]EDZ62686.1 diguanylate cyclase [Sulfurimonas gotlandica GD1]
MKFSFKFKLFFAFIGYGLILVLLTQLAVFKIEEISLKSASIKKASETFQDRNEIFKSYIKDTNLKLSSIISSDIFRSYLKDTKNIKLANSLFLDIASTSDNIMQLRYIDNTGMEIIRIDREEFSSETYLIEKEKLQNKSSRYYFKDISDTDQNVFWYSKLDLNIEQGKIEIPIKPVLRIGTPVFHNSKQAGILIINIFMKNFLYELVNTPLYDIFLFDNDGDILVDSTHSHCWNKYIEEDKTIYSHFAEEAKHIIYNTEYFGQNLYSNKISLNNGENLHMVIKPKTDYIQKEISEHLNQLIWIMIGIVLISFPISYFFSKTPIRLKEQADEQKKDQDVLLSLFDLSDAVLFKWNNDENWSVDSVSLSVDKLLGHTQNDFGTGTITYIGCIHHDDKKQVIQEVTKAIENKVYFFKHKPYRVVTKDGDIKWILDSTVIVRNANNEIINFVGYLTDISALKNSELKLQKLSRTDQLTKVSNRMHIDDVLQSQYYRFYRDNELTSIILLDIDFFKSVNDDYGHIVGDSVIIEFAKILQSSIRKGDILGRWGGEEFLIILPHTNLDQAMQLANKLQKIIFQNNFSTVKHKTASFGVSTFERGMSVETLIDSADKALYLSKENGRNCVTSTQTL